jgi:hypothetical protein
MNTKKILCLLAMSLAVMFNAANAQPTLTEANIIPQVGESYAVTQINFENQGNSGAGVTWNFSNITQAATFNYNYVAPSATPHSATFSSANLVNSFSGSFEFFSATASVYSRVGYVSPQGVVMQYSNPEDFLRFPFTYNSDFTDNFSCTFVNQGITFNRTGTITAEADGYGTLILPGGTLTDVLRLHVVEDYTDNYTQQGNPSTIDYYTEVYVWYKPGIHYPVLAFTEATSDISFNQYGLYYYPSSVGVHDAKRSEVAIAVLPNPADNRAALNISLQQQQHAHITLVNSLGQTIALIEDAPLQAGLHTYNLQLDAYADGIYFIYVKTNEDVTGYRLLIQN